MKNFKRPSVIALVVIGALFIISGLMYLPKDVATGIGTAVIGLVLVLLGVRKAGKPMPVKEPTANDAQGYNDGNYVITFRAAGVTFDNEDGINRQDVISKIADEIRDESEPEELFAGYSNREIIEDNATVSEFDRIPYDKLTIEEYEYEGKPALHLVSEYGIIGNVPEKMLSEYYGNINLYETLIITASLLGGKVKRCGVDYSDDLCDGKDVVDTDVLDYGVEVEFLFANKKE